MPANPDRLKDCTRSAESAADPPTLPSRQNRANVSPSAHSLSVVRDFASSVADAREGNWESSAFEIT